MNRHHCAALLVAVATAASIAPAFAEPMSKEGKTASGQTCRVTVEKHADGSITATGSSGGANTGSVSSSSSAGGSSVQVQAGGGSVSSSTTTGGPGTTASAGVVTVNGCTISTSSP